MDYKTLVFLLLIFKSAISLPPAWYKKLFLNHCAQILEIDFFCLGYMLFSLLFGQVDSEKHPS